EATYTCDAGNGPEPCKPGDDVNFGPLSENPAAEFTVVGTDIWQNSSTATFTWHVDGPGPKVIDVVSIPVTCPSSSDLQEFFTFAPDDKTGVPFFCTLDDSKNPRRCNQTATKGIFSWPQVDTDPPLSDGNHTLTVVAVDRFDNAGPAVVITW